MEIIITYFVHFLLSYPQSPYVVPIEVHYKR